MLCWLYCYLCNAGNHTQVVKLLLHYGANVEAKTTNGMTPIDFAGYETESWRVMYTAEYGILPKLPEQTDVVPIIPWYALQTSTDTDKKGKTNQNKETKDGQSRKRRK